jgi:small subunit ribosomal protein S7
LSQQLADLTQKLGRERSITAGREGGLAALRSIGQSGAQASRMMPMLGRQQQGQQTGQATSSPPQVQYRVSSPALAPSGYSITHVPRKHDPTIHAFINNLMRDGKKATTTTYVLDALRFMAKSLHADPLPAFREAIQLASPLVRMQTRKQGGKNTQVPLALFPRQSRRRGIMAIIEASRKRSDGEISVRIAKEIMAVLDGSSSAVTRKDDAHKLATVNRGNTGVRV